MTKTAQNQPKHVEGSTRAERGQKTTIEKLEAKVFEKEYLTQIREVGTLRRKCSYLIAAVFDNVPENSLAHGGFGPRNPKFSCFGYTGRSIVKVVQRPGRESTVKEPPCPFLP